jgi:hypothetical protein
VRDVPRIASFLALIVLLAGCAASTSDEVVDEPAFDDDDATDTLLDDDDATPYSYVGPAYESCVSHAQCDPGSACEAIPGYGGTFCSPPCDPDGDGDECALEGLPYGTSCLPNGRCARECADDEDIVPDDLGWLDGTPDVEDGCPEPLTCRDVAGEALCAGSPSGQSGFYGTCSHPMVEGADCPTTSACYGGSFIGTDEAGICLPHCDDGLCPTPANATDVSTICYDIGFDHPVCALLCTVGVSECPFGQFCFDIGFAGICAPEGAENPF